MMFENFLIEKYRPKTLDEIVLTEDIKEQIRKFQSNGEIPNLLFCSRAGSGKTSLAKIIVNEILQSSYLYINASDENGIDTVRSKVKAFAQTKSLNGNIKVIILDEADGLTSQGQRALRGAMEEYADNVRFILTANFKNNIIEAILSRTQLFEIIPPYEAYVARAVHVLKSEKVKVTAEEKKKLLALIDNCYPDLRSLINNLDKFIKEVDDSKQLLINSDIIENSIAEELFQKLLNKENVFEMRSFIIENEVNFGNDYHSLLRDLFEAVFNSQIDYDKKRSALIIIEDAKMKHNLVMDKEINAYACVLNLSKLF
jgi:DNA polymerase III delta prime subunit